MRACVERRSNFQRHTTASSDTKHLPRPMAWRKQAANFSFWKFPTKPASRCYSKIQQNPFPRMPSLFCNKLAHGLSRPNLLDCIHASFSAALRSKATLHQFAISTIDSLSDEVPLLVSDFLIQNKLSERTRRRASRGSPNGASSAELVCDFVDSI